MTNRLLTISLFVGLAAQPLLVEAADWITSRSTYTHNPQNGQRVDQFAKPVPVFYYEHPNFRTSGMRHLRSSLQVGGVADNSHVVESWGEEVRPYGEWRFPYRPYSVPYPAWGQPPGFGVGGFGVGVGGQGYLDPYGGSPHPEHQPRRGGRRPHYRNPHPYPHGGGSGPEMSGPATPPGAPIVGPRRITPIPRLFPRDPSRPATPDRWRPYHDGGYPTLPNNFYQPAY